MNDLSAQSGGYYLLGANNCWHGGIHITDEKFSHHKNKYLVRCMMDGEVIAYRLNQQYPSQSWQPNPQQPSKNIRYSNGFCLIRHKYESPKNQKEGPQNGKLNQLTFYSLYMHLADYQTYTVETSQQPQIVSITKNAKAREPERLEHSLGVLKRGSQVQVDPAQESQPFGSNRYYAVIINTPNEGSDESLVSGTRVYLYDRCFPEGTFPATGSPKLPVYWKGTVTAHSKEPMRVYDTKENCIQRIVEPIARLNEQQVFTFQSDKVVKNVMVKGVAHTIAECQYSSNATFAREPCLSGWMIVDESQVVWDKLEPTEFDSIVKFSEPLPISAGEPIGLMGIWESPKAPYTDNDIQSKSQMHVELFTTDNKSALDKFLGNEAGLTTGKKYLKVPKGSQLYSSDGSGNFVHPHELLSAARDYVFEESACTQVKDQSGVVFYNIKGIRCGEGATGPIDFAHVKIEGDVKLITQYDWKDLGFSMIEESNDNSDGYVDPDKIESPLFKDIFNKIDSSHDGVISGDEINSSLQQDKELRNELFQIIAGHPSEWHQTTQHNMKIKFDELNAENTDEKYKKANLLELDKFISCEFVSQIDELTQKLWHFHPIKSIGNLYSSDIITLDMLKMVSSADEIYLNTLLEHFNYFARIYKIDTPLRISHFLSQIGHESNLELKSENLNFSAKRMREIFGCARNQNGYSVATDSCTTRVIRPKLWSNEETYANSAENLGNYVYSSRMGNGDESSGDGYKYRGRGMMMLTGKNSYDTFQRKHNLMNPDDTKDFINNPDLILSDIKYAVETAFVYWDSCNVNSMADSDDFSGITYAINGGDNGKTDRLRRLNKIRPLFGLNKYE